MNDRRVIIVGGGVIGAACAHYLSRAGRQVMLMDQGLFGAGCSGGNCGLVCPSHIFPLAAPGAVRKAVRAMWRKDSPFSIKPRFDLSLWRWLFQFARCCNAELMMEAARARHALLDSSMRLFHELLAKDRIDCEWESRGLLFVFFHESEFAGYEETIDLERERFGVHATRYGPREVVDFEPALRPGVAGGWHYEQDAHLRPDKLLASWRSNLEAAGVEIRQQCAMKALVRDGRRAVAVETDSGREPADLFVVATGAWTPRFGKQLGCSIPIQPGKGYTMTMPRPSRCPGIPLMFPEHRVAVTPLQSGYRLGSTMEFSGYDPSIRPRRLSLLKDGAAPYLQYPYCEPVEEVWYGWRPMTYDGIPIIDRSPAMDNVYVAAGHNMLGLSMAPATGKLVAEMIDGQTPHLDPQPYSIGRFRRKG